MNPTYDIDEADPYILSCGISSASELVLSITARGTDHSVDIVVEPARARKLAALILEWCV